MLGECCLYLRVALGYPFHFLKRWRGVPRWWQLRVCVFFGDIRCAGFTGDGGFSCTRCRVAIPGCWFGDDAGGVLSDSIAPFVFAFIAIEIAVSPDLVCKVRVKPTQHIGCILSWIFQCDFCDALAHQRFVIGVVPAIGKVFAEKLFLDTSAGVWDAERFMEFPPQNDIEAGFLGLFSHVFQVGRRIQDFLQLLHPGFVLFPPQSTHQFKVLFLCSFCLFCKRLLLTFLRGLRRLRCMRIALFGGGGCVGNHGFHLFRLEQQPSTCTECKDDGDDANAM